MNGEYCKIETDAPMHKSDFRNSMWDESAYNQNLMRLANMITYNLTWNLSFIILCLV